MKKNNRQIPEHIALIMDGNRRWARDQKRLLIDGHRVGIATLEKVVMHAKKRGVSYVTCWAFSTENWKRGKFEVSLLLQVFREGLRGSIVQRLKENGVRIQFIGDLSQFPKDIQTEFNQLMQDTSHNTAITLIVALNYGGRAEIIRAINTALREKKSEISEEQVAQYLDTALIPDPDLIVRTGGEQRLSGFLPWQSVYSELYFTDVLWPAFDEEQLDIAIEEYSARDRRFGR